MSIIVSKNKSYVEQYNDFLNSKKTYTVKFYKEYEGKGGYWDCYDEWVPGPTIQETIVEKTFNELEIALGFADTVQETILVQEKERYIKNCWKYKSLSKEAENNDAVYWMSEFSFNFHNPNNHDLINAHINWGGSDMKMVITYNVIE